jgi:hypothetical protein
VRRGASPAVLDIQMGPLSASGHLDLGTLRFPTEVGEIARVFLFCGYEVIRVESSVRPVRP